MSFERGKYGIEYDPRRARTRRPAGCFLPAVALALLALFAGTRLAARFRGETPPRPALPPPPAMLAPATERGAAAAPAAKTPARPTAESADVARAERWAASGERRGNAERILLARLLEAERQGNAKVAIDAIEDLKDRPSMADLSDGLHRRLGELNFRRLFSGEATPWTAAAAVRRGDGRDRIARARNNTPALLERLNPGVDWNRLKPGDKITVLNYPSPALVVSKQLGMADLSLKEGRFFKRYYVSIPKTVKPDVYPVTAAGGETARAWLRKLGIRAVEADRAELEMFLAPGSRILVAE